MRQGGKTIRLGYGNVGTAREGLSLLHAHRYISILPLEEFLVAK